MPWRPNVTVAAVIEHNGRFLLVEEAPAGRPVLNQPAGHLERHESLLDAVVREVAEETCRVFTPEALVGIYLFEQAEPRPSYLRLCFCGQVGEVQATLTRDPDIIAVHWLAPEAIGVAAPAARSPLVQRCIEDYLAGRRLPLDALQMLPA